MRWYRALRALRWLDNASGPIVCAGILAFLVFEYLMSYYLKRQKTKQAIVAGSICFVLLLVMLYVLFSTLQPGIIAGIFAAICILYLFFAHIAIIWCIQFKGPLAEKWLVPLIISTGFVVFFLSAALLMGT